MPLMTTATPTDGPFETGEIVFASAVSGANILRDMREAITNTLGGQMSRYESVLEATISRALARLEEKARALGYDGVLDIRLSHPHIADGAIEVVATGTGFKYATP